MPRPRWRTCSAVPTDRINDDRLYRALDGLLPYDDALCRQLQDRYGNLFGATVDVLCLLYELTSAYWEGRVRGNQQARRGDSRDTRPDCPQVCIVLVTSRDGLPLAFEVFDGNRSDVTTTKYMVLTRSEEHTSELQSPLNLVCRL